MDKGRRGFTLIEVLVVVVIIGLLIAIAVPNYSKLKEKARLAQAAHGLHVIQVALERYATDHPNGYYPSWLSGGQIGLSSSYIRHPGFPPSNPPPPPSQFLAGDTSYPGTNMFPVDASYVERNMYVEGLLNKWWAGDPLLWYGLLSRYPHNPFVNEGRKYYYLVRRYDVDPNLMMAEETMYSRVDTTFHRPGDFLYRQIFADDVPASAHGLGRTRERSMGGAYTWNIDNYDVKGYLLLGFYWPGNVWGTGTSGQVVMDLCAFKTTASGWTHDYFHGTNLECVPYFSFEEDWSGYWKGLPVLPPYDKLPPNTPIYPTRRYFGTVCYYRCAIYSGPDGWLDPFFAVFTGGIDRKPTFLKKDVFAPSS